MNLLWDEEVIDWILIVYGGDFLVNLPYDQEGVKRLLTPLVNFCHPLQAYDEKVLAIREYLIRSGQIVVPKSLDEARDMAKKRRMKIEIESLFLPDTKPFNS